MSKAWRSHIIKKSLAVVSGCRSVVVPAPAYPETLALEQPVCVSERAGRDDESEEEATVRGPGAEGRPEARRQTAPVADPPDAQSQVAALLERARAEALRIEEEARQRGQREGWREGFRAGRREGWSQVKSEAKAVLREALAFLEDVQRQRASMLREAGEQVVQLAQDIAGQILGRELSTPDGLRDYAERILRRLQQGEKAVLHVHPEDVPLLEPWLPDLERACGVASLTLATSPALGRGGVMVETGHGYVDGRLEKGLQRVGEALLARLRAVAEAGESGERDGKRALE